MLYPYGYISSSRAEKYLEEKYPDDNFHLLGVSVDRNSSELFDLSPTGYTYVFSADGYKNKIYVSGELKGNNFYDAFQAIKYEDEAVNTLKKEFDKYFGKNNYCWYMDDYRNGPNNQKKDNGLYDYTIEELMPIFLIVSSDYSYNPDKLVKEISSNLESNFDTSRHSIQIEIYFDKDDNTPIFSETMVQSTEFFNYRDYNLWERALIIENKGVDDFDYNKPKYTQPKYEWKVNKEPNHENKTKNQFLNGDILDFELDELHFKIDGNTRLKDIIKMPNIAFVGNQDYFINPLTYYNEELVMHNADGSECRMDITIYNDTNKAIKKKDAKISGISIGSIYNVDALTFSKVSFGNMKIGDDFDEKEIVKRFGPYESKGKNKVENTVYTFVDGEDTVYSLMDSYSTYCVFYVNNNQIQRISYNYIKSSDFYSLEYRDFTAPDVEV